MNSRILAILSNIGLNHHESVIYMSCLEMGPSLAGAIIYKTKLPRATVYDSLARLSEKGLIAKSVKKNVAIFTANHPERLKSILDGEKRRINQAYNELDTLDEMLWNMSQNNMRIPKVRLYEGFT
jgi:sugar-specific transcriptional regulator TrmB